jgi:broad specificity phosphatase PhoE
MMHSHYILEIVLIILVKWIQFRGRARRNLDELYAGVCDGLTYQEIKEKFPEEFARRQEDKLTYRYPRGELLNYDICVSCR